MDNFLKQVALYVSDYFTEYLIFIFLAIGIGLLLIALFLPKKINLHKIDLKRMLSKKKTNVTMSKKVRYLHTLSKTGIFRILQIDENSIRYDEYEKLINKAGGLNGCSPDIIYMFKWLLLFGLLIMTTILNFILSITAPEIDTFTLFIGGIITSLLGYFSPEFYLKHRIKLRRKSFILELDTIELFTAIYLRAGYNIYDLLTALRDVTYYTKDYFNECVNEYYINQEMAIQNLADKIEIEEYQLLADILKQATRISGDNMIDFVEEHMRQMKKVKDLAIQEENKRRPLKYVFILALPLIGIVILWFYPLIIESMKVFKTMGQM